MAQPDLHFYCTPAETCFTFLFHNKIHICVTVKYTTHEIKIIYYNKMAFALKTERCDISSWSWIEFSFDIYQS